jgi:peroxiredoxin
MTDRTQPIAPGETAPDFTLPDQDSKEFTLNALRGQRVLLSFHPLAATGVCTEQMKALEADFDALAALNTVPVGISADPVPSKKLWADNMGLKKLRMVSDFWPHGAVIKQYGLFREKEGFSERANVLVDENGKIMWVKVYDIGTLPDIAEVKAQLKN